MPSCSLIRLVTHRIRIRVSRSYRPRWIPSQGSDGIELVYCTVDCCCCSADRYMIYSSTNITYYVIATNCVCCTTISFLFSSLVIIVTNMSSSQSTDLASFATKYSTSSSSSGSYHPLNNNSSNSNNTSSSTSSIFTTISDKFNQKVPLFSTNNNTQPLLHSSTAVNPSGIIAPLPVVTSTAPSVFNRVNEWWSPPQDNSLQGQFLGMFEMTWTQRIIGFVMSLTIGFIFLSFTFIYLPTIIVGTAAKFAISYAMTNICFILSSLFLLGPVKQFQSMMNEGRWIASLIYIITLVLTLYTSYAIRSFYIVLPCLLIQILSLLYYLFTLLPGGYANTLMMKVINGLFGTCYRTTRSILPI